MVWEAAVRAGHVSERVLIMVLDSSGGQASDLFGELTGIAVLLTMLPYFYSCVDLIRLEGMNFRNCASLIASILGCCFCFIALIGAETAELAGTFVVIRLLVACYKMWHYSGSPQRGEPESESLRFDGGEGDGVDDVLPWTAPCRCPYPWRTRARCRWRRCRR